jgi:hypothetical protein
MIKLPFLIIVLIILSFHADCQIAGSTTVTPEKLNVVSAEFGKTMLTGNISFDHKFKESNKGFRAFIGANISKYRKAFTAGAGGYILIGKLNNYFELGSDLGYIDVGDISDSSASGKLKLIYPDFSTKSYILSLNAGYRRYSKNMLLRIGFSPFLIKEGISPGGYFSIGFRL